MAVEVTAPNGTQWTVRRQWAPRTTRLGRSLWSRVQERRRRRDDREPGDWGEAVDAVGWLPDLGWLVLALVAVVVVVVVLGLVAFVIDLLVVAVLVVGGVVARVLFRRPWTVEARSDRGEAFYRQAVGWSASNRLRHELADDLAHGRAPGAGDRHP